MRRWSVDVIWRSNVHSRTCIIWDWMELENPRSEGHKLYSCLWGHTQPPWETGHILWHISIIHSLLGRQGCLCKDTAHSSCIKRVLICQQSPWQLNWRVSHFSSPLLCFVACLDAWYILPDSWQNLWGFGAAQLENCLRTSWLQPPTRKAREVMRCQGHEGSTLSQPTGFLLSLSLNQTIL